MYLGTKHLKNKMKGALKMSLDFFKFICYNYIIVIRNKFKNRGDVYMTAKEVVLKQLEKLNNGEVQRISFKEISLNTIQEAIGEEFEDMSNINGWEVDYWFETENYRVSGSMYYGTSTISLKVNN